MSASKSNANAETSNVKDKNTTSKSKTTGKKKTENVHEGHRARMRKRFIETELNGFEDHQILEMLLFYSCPRIDTNVMAHNLINNIGSLDEIFDSSVKDIMEIGGTNENTAVLLRMIPLVMERYHINKARTSFEGDRSKLKDYVFSLFYTAVTEKIFMICMDNNCSVISEDMIGQGSAGSVQCDTRKMVEIAVRNKASGIVIAHNHPGGNTHPSQEDILMTKKIADVMGSIQVNLIDHIIVNDIGASSMYERGHDDLFRR